MVEKRQETLAERETAADLSTVWELLLADATGDARRYGERVLYDNATHREICQQFHWSRSRAHNARRVWKAHVHRAAGSLPVKEAMRRLSADASRTVVWRAVFGPKGHSRGGYWEHKRPGNR
jgi:hypothetical protein